MLERLARPKRHLLRTIYLACLNFGVQICISGRRTELDILGRREHHSLPRSRHENYEVKVANCPIAPRLTLLRQLHDNARGRETPSGTNGQNPSVQAIPRKWRPKPGYIVVRREEDLLSVVETAAWPALSDRAESPRGLNLAGLTARNGVITSNATNSSKRPPSRNEPTGCDVWLRLMGDWPVRQKLLKLLDGRIPAPNLLVRKLDMRYNYCRELDAEQLCAALAVHKRTESLDLMGNMIHAEGAKALAGLLSTDGCQLAHLDLQGNAIANEGAIVLAKALEDNASLKILNLRTNGIRLVGARTLADMLLFNKSLEHINISWNRAAEQGGTFFGEVVRQSTPLRELLLEGCSIGEPGMEAVAYGLSANDQLVYLDVGYNKFGHRATRALADVLKTNSTLCFLNLSGNRLGDTGACQLAESLCANKGLKTLMLKDCDIGPAGAVSIAAALASHNHTLMRCDLSGNDIKAAGAKALTAALASNQAIKVLLFDGKLQQQRTQWNAGL